jgi:hypothetical protein
MWMSYEFQNVCISLLKVQLFDKPLSEGMDLAQVQT